MTKYCPECGAELKDDAKFCLKCGLNLNESEQTENTISSTNIETKSKAKGFLSFLDDWKKWSTGKKVGSIILVCCIGLIIIGAIGGILFPDLNTSEDRYYLAASSFVIPDDCSIREGGEEIDAAVLVQKDGSIVGVFEDYPPMFDGSEIVDSNETINVDGINVNKIKYHYTDGGGFTDYYFNKDNIDYCIVFDQQTEPNDNLVSSIVKTMDTEHGNNSDHKNVYPISSDTSSSSSNNINNGHEDRYDSYTGSSSSKSSNDNLASKNSNSNEGVGDSDVQVRITCKGKWSGSIGVGTSTSTYSGKGDKIINLDGSSSDIVAAVIQKESDSNGKLKVEIIKKGKVVKEASTTAAYGVVSVGD